MSKTPKSDLANIPSKLPSKLKDIQSVNNYESSNEINEINTALKVKLLAQTKGPKVVKSFTLYQSSINFLENLSKETNRSQSEILDFILEELQNTK